MKKYRRICIIALALLLTGCSASPNWDIQPSEEPAIEYGEWSYDGGAYTVSKEKSELVTAHADSGGNVEDIDVSVSLSGIEDGSDSSAVREVSNLSKITNKNGDEEFEQKDDHIYFQNLGKDIGYEGKGKEDLPVSVFVKYYLDGREKSPDAIAGRKGHVKVTYELRNNEQCDVEIAGCTRRVNVPFAAVTLVMLEGDAYSDLKTEDCKLSSLGSTDAIMALTMPGMKRNLDYLSADTSDADIPESFSFEMDTESFEMGFSTTIVTTNILDDSIDLSELDDLKKSLKDLESAGSKLSDAGSKVKSGMNKYGKYLSKYTGGAASLDKGVAKLVSGINKLDKGKAGIYNGAAAISAGVSDINAAYADADLRYIELLDEMIESDPGNEALKALKEQYIADHEVLQQQLAVLEDMSKGYTDSLKLFNAGISGLKDGAVSLRKGSSALSSRGDKLVDGYDSLKSGVSKYAKGVSKFYKKGISKMSSEGADKINDIERFVRMIEKADKMYNSYSGLDTGQTGKVTFIIETRELK